MNFTELVKVDIFKSDSMEKIDKVTGGKLFEREFGHIDIKWSKPEWYLLVKYRNYIKACLPSHSTKPFFISFSQFGHLATQSPPITLSVIILQVSTNSSYISALLLNNSQLL